MSGTSVLAPLSPAVSLSGGLKTTDGIFRSAIVVREYEFFPQTTLRVEESILNPTIIVGFLDIRISGRQKNQYESYGYEHGVNSAWFCGGDSKPPSTTIWSTAT
jgi:hypothetical protein